MYPTLIMLAGLPGTGKSTLAHALGKQLGWPVLDKDYINAVLLENKLEYTQAAHLAYELVLSLAHTLVVEQGQSMILDTAGRQPFILERAMQISQQANAKLKLIHCQASLPVRQERLQARSAGPSQLTQDQTSPEQEQAWYAHLPAERLILDTEQKLELLLPKIVQYIQKHEAFSLYNTAY